MFVFPYRCMHGVVLWANILFFTLNALFLRAAFGDPGYEPKDETNFLKLVERYDTPSAFCPACETICRRTLTHCYVCRKCVDHFDHHCTWINNCVGRKNHKVFYFYILLLLVYFVVLYARLWMSVTIQFEPDDLRTG